MLIQYVVNHTIRNSCKCEKCIEFQNDEEKLPKHTVNVYYFDVCLQNNPTKEDFINEIKKHSNPKNMFPVATPDGEISFPSEIEIDIFDKKEHNYIEIGGWIGDQGIALQFIALGKLLGIWEIMHPGIIFPNKQQKSIADQLAGMGMISILPCEI